MKKKIIKFVYCAFEPTLYALSRQKEGENPELSMMPYGSEEMVVPEDLMGYDIKHLVSKAYAGYIDKVFAMFNGGGENLEKELNFVNKYFALYVFEEELFALGFKKASEAECKKYGVKEYLLYDKQNEELFNKTYKAKNYERWLDERDFKNKSISQDFYGEDIEK